MLLSTTYIYIRTVAETWLLFTSAKLKRRDRVLGGVEKRSFISLPGKGAQNELMPSKLCPALEGVVRSLYSVQGAGRDQLVDILLIGWW